MSGYVTYETFRSKEQLMDLAELLNYYDIDYLVEDYFLNPDITSANTESSKEYCIKLLPEDFERVTEIRNKHAVSELDDVNDNHYLFEYTNEELLMEVIAKKDEWSSFDYALARKILKDRDVEVTDDQVHQLTTERIKELSKPDGDQKGWIVFGYILAFLGGLLGILIGFHLKTHKKTLPNGERVYAYSHSDRKHGNRILIIGTVFAIIGMIIRLTMKFK